MKLDLEVIDTISFGLFLARLHKGTHIATEQTRVNDEVWLPRHTAVHVDVRVALLKNFNVDMMRTKRNVIERAAILAQSDFSIGASIQIVEHRARQTFIRNRSKISDADNPGRSNGS